MTPFHARSRFAVSVAVVFLGVLATVLVAASPARASQLPTGFQDQLVADSLGQPVGLAEVPDPASGASRRVLFVEQRTARVAIIVDGGVFTVGTVPGVASIEAERGLLGVAVDPGWPARPYLYVHCTDGRNGNTIAISRFTLTGDLARTGDGRLAFDAATRYDLLNSLPDSLQKHNGGTVRFGLDGRLYASLGDDGSGCPAQDSTRLVGKILRLDVGRLPAGPGGPAPYALLAPPDNPWAASPDSAARLVWTLGLRNPFRFQVDPGTGSLVIADVGENTWEELDLANAGGMNMGWPLREGPAAFTSCAHPSSVPFTDPIAWYDHTLGRAVIAGPRYRRPPLGDARFPAAYDGDCFYLDYYSGWLWRITDSGGAWAPAAAVPGQPDSSAWGTGFATTSDMIELADGSIWYCMQFAPGTGVGQVHRIAYTQVIGLPRPHPGEFTLAAPWPSPTRGSVTIAWSQAADAAARITVHDLGGRRVRTLRATGLSPAGPHQLVWDGRDEGGRAVPPGIYVVRVHVGNGDRQASISLVR